MWYNLPVCKPRQEICIGYLVGMTRNHWDFYSFVQTNITWTTRQRTSWTSLNASLFSSTVEQVMTNLSIAPDCLCSVKCQGRLTTFHPPEHRWRSIPGDLSIKVDLSGPFWGHCLEKRSDIATASDWGWEVDGSKFMPKWTVLPIAEKVCLELISCKCTKPCRGNCKCYRANSVCTALCKCRGICYVIWFT